MRQRVDQIKIIIRIKWMGTQAATKSKELYFVGISVLRFNIIILSRAQYACVYVSAFDYPTPPASVTTVTTIFAANIFQMNSHDKHTYAHSYSVNLCCNLGLLSKRAKQFKSIFFSVRCQAQKNFFLKLKVTELYTEIFS